MWGGFIGSQIRRTNRNLLITNACLLLGVGVLLAVNAKYLNDWFRGNVAVEPARLAQLRSPDDMPRNFVTFDVPSMLETGYQEVEKSDAGKVTGVEADFQLVPAEDRALLVKTPPGSKQTHLAGQLVKAPTAVFNGVRDALPKEYQDKLLPFMLNTKGYRENGYWLLAICVPLALLGLWNLGEWTQHTRDFNSHPLVKELGGAKGMVECGAQVDAEMVGGQVFGKAKLTPHWIAVSQPFGTRMTRLDNLAWTYKKVTSHSVTFIPTGKTYELILWPSKGSMYQASGKEEQVDQLLVAIAERAPWVIAGFSAELEHAWKKDRKGFLAAVEERRNGSGRKSA